jgi:uncharacterized protein (TIGR02231 family)
MLLRRLALATALSLCLSAQVFAADIAASSKVTAATVYADRATVTREAVIDLPAGESTVVLSGLPAFMLTDALRAEGSAMASVKLGAVETKLVTSAELAAPREREIRAELQKLEDAQALALADHTALDKRKEFLESLSRDAASRTREALADLNLKPEQWTKAAAEIGTQIAEVLRGQQAKKVEMRELSKQIEALNEELAQLQTGQTNSYEVRVPLEAASATRLVLKITYQVPNASWQPVYDLRLDTTGRSLKLTQFGEVSQRTGEDWDNVSLTLSTAQPAREVALPALSPLWVSPREIVTMRAQKARMETMSMALEASGAAAPMAAMDSVAAAPVPQEARFTAATINTNGYVAEYGIVGQSSVKADGTARKVMVGDVAAKVTLQAEVRPQFAEEAYLVASTQLAGDVTLLPGQANLFRDGTYIGTIPLELMRPGSQVDLTFGVDDQIEVKRSTLKDEKGESGVISKAISLTRAGSVNIANLHKDPMDVVVKYNLPVPRDEKITLKLDDAATTAGYAMDVGNVKGLMQWKLPLAAKEKKDVKFGWSLSWPTDMEIDYYAPY